MIPSRPKPPRTSHESKPTTESLFLIFMVHNLGEGPFPSHGPSPDFEVEMTEGPLVRTHLVNSPTTTPQSEP